jgi:hypothetical protein
MIELDLRDIHLPESVPWWPPAPGWWLSALLLILIAAAGWWWLRARRQPLKRQALRELGGIRRAFEDGAGSARVLAEISVLIRRIAISRRGRAEAASLSGEAWQDCIGAISGDPAFDRAQLDLLSRGRYQRDPHADIHALLVACERWLRALPRE